MSKDKLIRVDKLLSNMGYGTRKDIDALTRAGAIKYHENTVGKGSDKVALNASLAQGLRVSGMALDPLPGFAIMLHKPLGVTCSRKDSGPLIFDLLPPRWLKRDPAISTVGRLDKDTSGLIILTDDGQLNHRISSPKSDTPKRYEVTLDRPLTGDETKVFANGGLMLEGETKPLLPAELEVLSPTKCVLTLHEGRYHQVRRMFASQGNHVVTLHRASVGGLTLGDLKPGEWRLLDQSDIDVLFGESSHSH
jgi:16S rRNA pseudouridine516 synthase